MVAVPVNSYLYRICGSHSDVYEGIYLHGYIAVQSVESQLGIRLKSTNCLPHIDSLFVLLFSPVDSGDVLPRNVGPFSTDYIHLSFINGSTALC
jgi:hypothetical protein